jgi:predicted nuclease of restriction endonuclease-like RecB superfamily
MYPVINQMPDLNATGGSFWDQFSHIPGTIESRIPTFDKSLDTYFDQHFAAIIEEWDLVTENDLLRLERRLAQVTDEISGLYVGKVAIEARAKALDDLITSLEGSV